MTPALSVVVVARNDDHGGRFLERMQLFVDALVALAERHRLGMELIVVEWNPEPGRSGLEQALSWPSSRSSTWIRIITVPPELHRSLDHSSELRIFQMIGKNVGIRRARGEFILATNVDLLFSDELVAFLASGKLRKGQLYRIDRTDVPASIPGASIDEQLEFCAANVLRVHTALGSVRPGGRAPLKRQIKQVLEGVLARLEGRRNYFDAFTNAAGDFTLLSRDDWDALHAYAELQRWSLFIDGLLCCAALGSGLAVTVLEPPMRLFHMEHEQGFETFAVARTNPNLRHALPWKENLKWSRRLLAGQGIPWPDSEDWGFESARLPEVQFQPTTG